MSILNTIVGAVFPPRCVICRRQGSDLCLACIGGFSPAEREHPDWIFPVYDYRNQELRNAIWLLKYNRRKRLARALARAIHPRMAEELADFSQMENFRTPLLVPIPLSRKRMRERGFNQAELICRELCVLDKEENFAPAPRALRRIKDSEHQARLENRADRLKNIVDSFAANPEIVRGRNIILIDDVTTTGATLEEARKALREAGAKKVIAFTVAH
ncbi:MAG TPA: ComF family protein [Candidatus Paceibacterota bacterium]|jgi:ComF family protein|nr:ComF family protein [Candidatus Paceibacterota bacterium]